MLKNENIICISSIDWDFIWQGHQEIMSALAKNGNRVLFIENTGVRAPGIRDISRIKNRIKNWFRGIKGIREERANLYIFSPLVLPFPYSRIAKWINHNLILSILNRWARVMDFTDPIIWTFLPTPLSLDIIESLVNKIAIYYCIDNFSFSSVSAKKVKRSEEKLLRKIDLVFATSRGIYDYCSKYNKKVYNFPFAVNFSEFENVRLKEDIMPDELKDIKSPIIGYIGGVHKWIDQAIVREAAKKYPECSFVFVGPIQTNISLLLSCKNIHFLGQKEHERLPFFIKHFDVCIIPYLITDYTRNVYPTKLNEYLAMSKPVVSTNIPEVRAFDEKYSNVVYLVEDGERFTEYIDRAIKSDNQVLKNKRIEAAKENSWDARIEKMSELINREIEKKRLDIEARWKGNLISFYRRARRKTLGVVGIGLFLYLLFFKTPFVWFLASPLRISDIPQKADAIVVFGGGVGETGSPGKSTIERARYAGELYLKGYAEKIVFSSGYTYIHNDAENMSLLGISMGVSPKDIILEQKANNTYENVIFTKAILDRYGWSSILLVSSPYNMRRAYLVFRSHCKGLNVFYTPVLESQFYDRAFGVRSEQIMAIIHEYLGIFYYRFKGYI